MSEIVIGIGSGVIVVAIMRLWSQVSFYRAYFRQKQENAGKDPKQILRQEFGRMWWWFA